VKKLLIASTNPGKTAEIKLGLKDLKKLGITILTLNDVIVGEKSPEETGVTFKENAFIKAKFYAETTNLPVISDDGGLIIPYLNNEPGVKSRRWLGYDASDQELIEYTLKRLHGVRLEDRRAYLETYLCFYNPKTKDTVFETGKILGTISKVAYPKQTPGFPYRDLLIISKFNKYYDELTPEEHAKINHRLKALKRLVKKIITRIQ